MNDKAKFPSVSVTMFQMLVFMRSENPSVTISVHGSWIVDAAAIRVFDDEHMLIYLLGAFKRTKNFSTLQSNAILFFLRGGAVASSLYILGSKKGGRF